MSSTLLETLSDLSAEQIDNHYSVYNTFPSQVAEGVFRSAAPKDAQTVSDWGNKYRVSSVLCLDNFSGGSVAEEKAWVEQAGMDFHWWPMSRVEKPSVDAIKSALFIMNWKLARKQSLLVHCQYGLDRTGLVIAAFRIKVQGWSVDDARREMRKLGHTPLLYWWDDVLEEL